MLRPRYRLVGGCHLHGHTAVRRGRLRPTRKVIFAKNHEREKKSRQKDWQLDFALKKPLKRSHKGTCLFASMQIGILKRMVDLHLWTVKPLTHGQCTTEIEFRCGRPEKRPQRSASPLAWLSSVSLSLPTRLFFQFVLKVQYISTHYTKTLKKRWSWYKLQLLLYALWLWPTSNSEHPCCLPLDFNGSNYYIIILLSSVLIWHWCVSSYTIFCKTSCKQCF